MDRTIKVKEVRFEDAEPGKCFEHKNSYYLKLNRDYKLKELKTPIPFEIICNAVRLDNGDLYHFPKKEPVVIAKFSLKLEFFKGDD